MINYILSNILKFFDFIINLFSKNRIFFIEKEVLNYLKSLLQIQKIVIVILLVFNFFYIIIFKIFKIAWPNYYNNIVSHNQVIKL